ncbi:MAG: LysE family transporter [Thermoleophilia bacterium]|nr:LysE family transporter [Thermoleophilia bacterium]
MELVLMFFSSMLIAYSGAIMPGPMLAVVVAESPRQGVRAGPLVVLGHALLELALLGLLVLGLGPLLEREGVQAVLSVLGGVMLVATAAVMLLSVARDTARLEYGAAGGRAHGRAVLGGVVSSLSNPYWSIWWATIGLSLLTKAYALGAAALVAFYVGHILGDLTWYSAVSGVIAAGRRWITPRRYRVMVAVMACFLLGLAAWFVVSGVRLAG